MQAFRFAVAVLTHFADYLEGWAIAIRRRVWQTLPEDKGQPTYGGTSWEQKSALRPPAHWLERVRRDAPQLLSEDSEGVITAQVDPEAAASHAGSHLPKSGLRQISAAHHAQAIPIYQPRRFIRRERRLDKQGIPELARSPETLHKVTDELRISSPEQPTVETSESPLVIRSALHRQSQGINDTRARYKAATFVSSSDPYVARPAQFSMPSYPLATVSAGLEALTSQGSRVGSAQVLRQGAAEQEQMTVMSGQQVRMPDLRTTTLARQQVEVPHNFPEMGRRPPLPAVGDARQPSQMEPRNGSLLISDEERWPDLLPQLEAADEPEQMWRLWQHRQRLNREQRGRW